MITAGFLEFMGIAFGLMIIGGIIKAVTDKFYTPEKFLQDLERTGSPVIANELQFFADSPLNVMQFSIMLTSIISTWRQVAVAKLENRISGDRFKMFQVFLFTSVYPSINAMSENDFGTDVMRYCLEEAYAGVLLKDRELMLMLTRHLEEKYGEIESFIDECLEGEIPDFQTYVHQHTPASLPKERDYLVAYMTSLEKQASEVARRVDRPVRGMSIQKDQLKTTFLLEKEHGIVL